jgi:hypothetical protein
MMQRVLSSRGTSAPRFVIRYGVILLTQGNNYSQTSGESLICGTP